MIWGDGTGLLSSRASGKERDPTKWDYVIPLKKGIQSIMTLFVETHCNASLHSNLDSRLRGNDNHILFDYSLHLIYHESMQKAIIGILIFIIVLMFFSGLFFFYEARYMSGRASVVNNSIDPNNSYITYNPLSAKASGDEKIRVTVVVLSPQGLGVSGIAVSLSNPGDALKVETINGTTDTIGRALFNISTKTAGEYTIEAKAGGVALTQKVKLLFN